MLIDSYDTELGVKLYRQLFDPIDNIYIKSTSC